MALGGREQFAGFQRFEETILHKLDVLLHSQFCRTTILAFQGLIDLPVAARLGTSGEVISLDSTEQTFLLNVFKDATKFCIS